MRYKFLILNVQTSDQGLPVYTFMSGSDDLLQATRMLEKARKMNPQVMLILANVLTEEQ